MRITEERIREYYINLIIKVSTDSWHLFYHTYNIQFIFVKWYSDLTWNGCIVMRETEIIAIYRHIFFIRQKGSYCNFNLDTNTEIHLEREKRQIWEHKAMTVQCKNRRNVQGNTSKETEDPRCAVHMRYFLWVFVRDLYLKSTSCKVFIRN